LQLQERAIPARSSIYGEETKRQIPRKASAAFSQIPHAEQERGSQASKARYIPRVARSLLAPAFGVLRHKVCSMNQQTFARKSPAKNCATRLSRTRIMVYCLASRGCFLVSFQQRPGTDDKIRVAGDFAGDNRKSNYPVEFPSGGP
jgi:hypothetical protein